MESRIEEAREWMFRAEEALQAARALLERGFFREAVSRGYYAMFYAAKGAVTLEGIEANKHSTVISAFGKAFIKSGRLPQRLHRSLLDAFNARNDADYSLDRHPSKSDVEKALVEAEGFVSETRRLLPQE